MNDQQLYNYGISKIKEAIAYDNQKKYKLALDSYKEGIEKLMFKFKYERNPKAKETLYKRLKEYMNRAEELESRQKQQVVPIDTSASSHDDETTFAFETLEKDNTLSWDDVAGLEDAKQSLKEAVIIPLKFPQLFNKESKRKPWKGILLYGSPGCGKSFLAKVVASVSNASFFSISSSDIVSKWQGESEKAIKNLFKQARENAPAVIFIDEIDSMCGERSDGENESSRRIKTEFLVQMEGVGSNNNNVLVLGATNTPWSLDPAMRRRFEKRIYIPLPDFKARKAIIKSYLNNMFTDVDIDEIVHKTNGFSGSDISVLMRDVLMGPVRRCQHAKQFIKNKHGKYIPCDNYPNCANCPLNLHDDKSVGKQCEICGATCITLYDINEDELEIPPITTQDIKTSMKSISKSVSSQDLERYDDWKLKFGS